MKIMKSHEDGLFSFMALHAPSWFSKEFALCKPTGLS
jgi:hypothetical protein